jgi:hypothetical protein
VHVGDGCGLLEITFGGFRSSPAEQGLQRVGPGSVRQLLQGLSRQQVEFLAKGRITFDSVVQMTLIPGVKPPGKPNS